MALKAVYNSSQVNSAVVMHTTTTPHPHCVLRLATNTVGDKDLGGLEDFASVHSGAHKGLVIGATDYRHDWLSGLLPLVPPFFSTLDLASLIATSAPGLIVTIDASQVPQPNLHTRYLLLLLTLHPPAVSHHALFQDAPTVNVLTIKEYPDKIFHPHGVSLLPPARTTSTNPVLLLVNHMPNGDRIERFEVLHTSHCCCCCCGDCHLSHPHTVSPCPLLSRLTLRPTRQPGRAPSLTRGGRF